MFPLTALRPAILRGALSLAALTVSALSLASVPQIARAEFSVTGAARVVDGDTLDIAGTKIRLFGIDAPESAQSCNGLPCGQQSTAFMQRITSGRQITCTGAEYDAYDRLLAHCFAGKVDLGGTMIANGHAMAFVRYSRDYLPLEDEARAAGRGLWARGTPQTPWDFRASRWNSASQVTPENCPIKGNISRSGERIYHTPYSRSYAATRISTDHGERWFCSEAEALAAGWRAPLR
ncbi:thermonuclease family protein [Pseudooceanicola algae]|uniref:Uncharacterized protein n=1 Tax=Pseudooceanicola algae TaxID=1537215 RepID=A0A418SFD1_9RHOB|nr:thermonuclease family protein [Pseudooceanicola algae]QPM89204.1 hypothetical protein PSAL_004190 [Pseudooceanicola algae]